MNLLYQNRDQLKFQPNLKNMDLIFAIPPDPSWCMMHRLATSVGKNSDNSESNINFCPCCDEPAAKLNFSVNCSIKKFRIYGPGVPLFYYLIKFLIINTIFEIIGDMVSFSYFLDISFKHRNEYSSDVLSAYIRFLGSSQYKVFNLLVYLFPLILQLGYSIYFIRNLKVVFQSIKIVSFDGSARAILLSQIPSNINEDGLRQLFNNKESTENCENIENIIWVPYLDEYKKHNLKLIHAIKKKIKLLLSCTLFHIERKRNSKSFLKLNEFDEKYKGSNYVGIGSLHLRTQLTQVCEIINEETEILSQISRKYFKNPEKFSIRKAFIRFKSVDHMKLGLEIMESSLNRGFMDKKCCNQTALKWEYAIPPSDINWENIDRNLYIGTFFKIIAYNIIILISLSNVSYQIFLLQYDYLAKHYFLYACALFFGTFLTNIVNDITSYYMQQNFTEFSYSKALAAEFHIKFFGFLVNTILLPIYPITIHNGSEKINHQKAYIIYFIFIVISFGILSNFSDFILIKNIQKYYYSYKLSKGTITSIMWPQIFVNQYVEKLDYNILPRYVAILLALCSSEILFMLCPLTKLIFLVCLFFTYWFNKFIFVKLSRKPQYISQDLPKQFLNWLFICKFAFIWLNYSSVCLIQKKTISNSLIVICANCVATIVYLYLIYDNNKVLGQKESIEDRRLKSQSSLVTTKLTLSYEFFLPLKRNGTSTIGSEFEPVFIQHNYGERAYNIREDRLSVIHEPVS